MAGLVSVVLRRRCPSQIVGSIIVAVSVPMSDPRAIRWASSVERGADNDMHGDGIILPERDFEIMALFGRAQNTATPETTYAIASGDPTIYRSNTSEVAGLIARIPWNGSPLFIFSGVA
jgi:hypothetical protein